MCSSERGIRTAGWLLAASAVLHLSGASADGLLLSAGGEVDDQEGFRLDAGLVWLATEKTSLTALAGRADSSTDFDDFSSTSASLGVDHHFDPLGAALEVRWWGDSGLLQARTLAGTLYYKRNGWRLALQAESRRSDFDRFAFDSMIPVRNGTGIVFVPVAGSASCNLDNSALGLSLSHTGAAWMVSLGGIAYDYSNTDCSLRDLVLPPQLGRLPPLSREVFRRIAARVLNVTGQLIGTQITRDNGYLESMVSAALSYRSGPRTWGLNYFHDREEFAGLQSDTLIGSVTLPVGGRFDLELRLGATHGDLTDTVPFAGLSLLFYL